MHAETDRPRRGLLRTTTTKTLAIASLSLSLMACATPPKDPAERAAFEQTNDPFEPANRQIFEVNQFLDKWVIEPVAEGYRKIPQPVRTGVRNFLGNLREPTVLANNLLQGEVSKAGITTARILINTTLGLGFFDPATKQGYETQIGDFGQTMHHYGLKSGPYLVLPILGPSNVRDAIGSGVDSFIDPFRYVASANHANSATWGRAGTEGVDQREQAIEPLDDLKRNSVDFYAQLRSVVRQRRAAQLGEPLPGVSTESADLYADPLTAAVPTQGRRLNHQ